MIYRVPGRAVPEPALASATDPPPPPGWPGLEEIVEMVCAAVRRDAFRYLDQPITPFSTVRSLMGSPPSRWRPWVRRAWLARLREQLVREIRRHYLFCAMLVRVLGRCPAYGTLGGDPCDAGTHG